MRGEWRFEPDVAAGFARDCANGTRPPLATPRAQLKLPDISQPGTLEIFQRDPLKENRAH